MASTAIGIEAETVRAAAPNYLVEAPNSGPSTPSTMALAVNSAICCVSETYGVKTFGEAAAGWEGPW